jgi:hypothetical protein
MSTEKPPLPKQLSSYVTVTDGVWDKRKIRFGRLPSLSQILNY